MRSFTITFPTDILGVIARAGRLTASDVLGAPGTLYGGAPADSPSGTTRATTS